MKFVRAYHHHDGSIGVLVRFEIGTDFTSRTTEFKDFADTAAMSFAACMRNHGDGNHAFTWTNLEEFEDLIWMGPGDEETLGEALKSVSKFFGEKISIDFVSFVMDGEDRRPKEVQERAARGNK